MPHSRSTLAGQTGVLLASDKRSKVSVWVQLELKPLGSVAVQVRVMIALVVPPSQPMSFSWSW